MIVKVDASAGWGKNPVGEVTCDGLWWVMNEGERCRSICIGSLTETVGTIGGLFIGTMIFRELLSASVGWHLPVYHWPNLAILMGRV